MQPRRLAGAGDRNPPPRLHKSPSPVVSFQSFTLFFTETQLTNGGAKAQRRVCFSTKSVRLFPKAFKVLFQRTQRTRNTNSFLFSLMKRSPLSLPASALSAEEHLNADLKTLEKVPLMAPTEPFITRSREHKSAPGPPVEFLHFQDISAAALKIQQSGIQKTPYISKLYGMEIYVKKEHLHYTGSVKERRVLCLLSSLKQKQQKKGVIVAMDCSFSMAMAHHTVELRIPVFVIMPAYSCLSRLRMFCDYGAMVISYGSMACDSQNHACHLAQENSYLYLEEHESVVYLAGLGTVGVEVHEQCGILADPLVRSCGIESEEFPLLPHSRRTDTPIKGFGSIPVRKLYGSKDTCIHTYTRSPVSIQHP
uniref:L-serine deaminase n=1 Tax=Electrophorus electricus TaxID=8005 RepID=A0A4W4GIZ2_ELEEL